MHLSPLSMLMFASEPLPRVAEIQHRLGEIFPVGMPDRGYLMRRAAARLVFAMLYIDAVDGQEWKLAPVHVYRMSDGQAKLQGVEERRLYREMVGNRKYRTKRKRWMADNSREAVRDESMRALVLAGAVRRDDNVATTSSHGRYVLEREFAALFAADALEFGELVRAWRETHLSKDELARIRIVQERPVSGNLTINIPGGSRSVAVGPSSVIMKAVAEEFTARFLEIPRVLWMSESRNKVILQDDTLMRTIGLPLDRAKLLPDMVLADVGGKIRLFFVEIVATDGPFTRERRDQVLRLTDAGGFSRASIHFVSAFAHRDSQPLKKRFSALAENTYAWFMAEPDVLIWITNGAPMTLVHRRIGAGDRPQSANRGPAGAIGGEHI